MTNFLDWILLYQVALNHFFSSQTFGTIKLVLRFYLLDIWQHCQSFFLFVFEKDIEFEFTRWDFPGKIFREGNIEWEFPREDFLGKHFQGEI